MSCFQLEVGGSGTSSPSTVKIPGAYSASDPGILIDIYASPKAYTSELHSPILSFNLRDVYISPWPNSVRNDLSHSSCNLLSHGSNVEHRQPARYGTHDHACWRRRCQLFGGGKYDW